MTCKLLHKIVVILVSWSCDSWNIGERYLQENFFLLLKRKLQICYWYTPNRWIVLFARADWLVRKWITRTIHLRVGEEPKGCVNNLISDHIWRKQTNILEPVWYIVNQLLNSVLVKVVDIYHYSSPFRWIIVNYVMSKLEILFKWN